MTTTRITRETEHVSELEDVDGYAIYNVDGEEIRIINSDGIATTWTARTAP